MADPITDLILSYIAAEDILPAVYSFFEGLFGWLGDEGSQLLFDIIGSFDSSGINIINDAINVNQDGMITGWSRTIKIAGVDTDKLLRFLQIVASNMIRDGVSLATDSGRKLFTSILSKLDEYSGYINAAGLASFIAQQTNSFTKSNNNPKLLPKSGIAGNVKKNTDPDDGIYEDVPFIPRGP